MKKYISFDIRKSLFTNLRFGLISLCETWP